MSEMPTLSSSPRFEMRGIRKRFGGTVALDGVDFAVSAAEVHALVGENGAGKSTLMKILSGAVPADAGLMFLSGAPYLPRSPLEARREGVAMIYQELSLCPHLTVEENIMLGMEPTRWGLVRRSAAVEKARAALAALGHPELSPAARVGDLAVGSQQIVEIARALAVGCRVLVLDEPTSSLSQEDVRRLFGVIERLKSQGHAIVYISHFLEEVMEVADRFTVLRDGVVAGAGRVAETSVERMVDLMVGRNIGELYPRSERNPGEVLLEVADLGDGGKLERAGLELRRGEVLGIAGLIGAGRTELLRAIFGLEKVKRGRIKVGVYVGPASPARRWLQGMGMLSEDRKGDGLALSMSVADNLTLSRLSGFGPWGLIFPSRQAAAAEKWIAELAIRCQGPEQSVLELSGGNQQKVALARLLHHDVDIFLLDEPTRGIDVASKAQIYRLINQLTQGTADRPARAVLMVSSYLPELIGICDRIAVMYRGRLGPARLAKELSERDLMLAATGQDGGK